MTDIKRMEELIDQLNNATRAYDEGKPYMSDHEWDRIYFELSNLEKKLNFAYSNSPTQNIHFQTVSALKKVVHNHPMLSLEKTKSLEDIAKFIDKKSYLAMCKMDGLTCSLRYYNGKLVSAETRGNGVEGEDILHNALVIPSIPKYIDYKDELIVDGEIICRLDTFSNMFAGEYKNARNFAAGSIRLLDSKECHQRNLTFVAWDVIKGYEDEDELFWKLNALTQLGFTVVPHIAIYLNEYVKEVVSEETIKGLVKEAEENAYAIDGIVFKFNDVEYGKSLGATEHHFRNAMAFKFYDETYPTILKDIEWTMGRTGVLTPVAIFEPIDIDGSTVSRASLHNISIMAGLFGPFGPCRGDEIEVFKANMIIPQIKSVKNVCSHYEEYQIKIPHECPICGGMTQQWVINDSVSLICIDSNCPGKLINRLDYFCGKKGLDIKGLSKATLEKLIDWGWVSELIDIYKLNDYKAEWVQKPGFGEKSVTNILAAIEASKNPSLQAFISAIGIPLIGKSMSKELVKYISSYEEFRKMVNEKFDFSKFDGFAGSKTDAIWNYDYRQADDVYELVKPLSVEPTDESEKSLANYSIVITGRLTKFKNRAELQRLIEEKGGKVVGSVSNNTDFLINNDINSTSAKNMTARKLNIPIITEEDFAKRFL